MKDDLSDLESYSFWDEHEVKRYPRVAAKVISDLLVSLQVQRKIKALHATQGEPSDAAVRRASLALDEDGWYAHEEALTWEDLDRIAAVALRAASNVSESGIPYISSPQMSGSSPTRLVSAELVQRARDEWDRDGNRTAIEVAIDVALAAFEEES